MKHFRWVLLSLGLNAVFAIVLVALGRRPTPTPPTERGPSARLTNSILSLAAEAAPGGTASVAPQRFHWRDLASEDFKVYVANLRRIGCPQATLRDIIAGELEDLYLRRRKALIDPLQNDFWTLAMRGLEQKEGRFEKVKAEIEKLEEATIDKLDELVGPEVIPAENKPRNATFAFLPEEKRVAIEALNQRFAKLRRETMRGPDGKPNPASREQVADLQKQREGEIKQLLTPEEYTEYRLRTSSASKFASRLIGFETTEDELRSIARVRLDFESADTALDRKAPDYLAKLAEQQVIKKQRDGALKELLGAERFTEFTRAQDGAYHEIYRVAERYGLPRETAVEVDGIRQAALEQAKAVREK
ncbi:MAG TPA: hypothetical protein VFA77_01280, partial [Candidatus Eisenbacteria bacterium]|nr:hypothetical protein [Candidatus Eisenbacteria bacterium]